MNDNVLVTAANENECNLTQKEVIVPSQIHVSYYVHFYSGFIFVTGIKHKGKTLNFCESYKCKIVDCVD